MESIFRRPSSPFDIFIYIYLYFSMPFDSLRSLSVFYDIFRQISNHISSRITKLSLPEKPGKSSGCRPAFLIAQKIWTPWPEAWPHSRKKGGTAKNRKGRNEWANARPSLFATVPHIWRKAIFRHALVLKISYPISCIKVDMDCLVHRTLSFYKP